MSRNDQVIPNTSESQDQTVRSTLLRTSGTITSSPEIGKPDEMGFIQELDIIP